MSLPRRRGSQSSVRSVNNKVRAFLKHTCYICGNTYSSARQTINHVRKLHGYDLPPREVGRNRPPSKVYEYVRDRNEDYDEGHFACPSCWFHCQEDDLPALTVHTREVHDPVKADPTKEDDDGYMSAASGSSFSRRRSASVSRPRSTSAQPNSAGGGITENAAKEISGKLDELTDLFKAFFTSK